MFREVADDGRPFTDVPPVHDAVDDVGISGGKLLGDGWRVATKQEDGAVDRVRQRAAKNQIAPVDCLSRVCEMSGAKWRAPLCVVRTSLVEQQVVHRSLVQ